MHAAAAPLSSSATVRWTHQFSVSSEGPRLACRFWVQSQCRRLPLWTSGAASLALCSSSRPSMLPSCNQCCKLCHRTSSMQSTVSAPNPKSCYRWASIWGSFAEELEAMIAVCHCTPVLLKASHS